MGGTDRTLGFAARRSQAIFSLTLLALLVGTCLVTDLLARNRALERWLMTTSRDFAEKNGAFFSYTGNFIDFEERFLLDEVPQADYSQGGVYFFGTSNMKWAFQTWDLPTELRQFIGNYGIGASSHTDQLQFIKYLIEQRGFLTAGDRDLVVFGVSFHLGHHVGMKSAGFLASVLRRQGLYTITANDRIAPAPMSAIERWLRTEKARCGGFIWNLGRLAKNWVRKFWSRSDGPLHDGATYRRYWSDIMGPRWQQDIDAEVEQLRETILLVQSRGALVKVLLLPQGTWMEELPFKAYYEAQIRTLCQATSTSLIDLSRAIPNEEFADSNHLTVQGQERFRSLIMGGILKHFREVKRRPVFPQREQSTPHTGSISE
jgi:hypothetical protein